MTSSYYSSASSYASYSSKSSESIDKVVPSLGNAKSNGELVLVTGGSGFIASHIIYQLFTQGYNVRASVRDAKKHLAFFQSLYLSAKPGHEGHGLKEDDLFEMDLLDQDQSKWDKLVEGCDYVIHSASPLKLGMSEKDLVKAAVNGTECIMHAVANAKHPVKKTIVTSSFAAVGMGHKKIKKPLNDDSWSTEVFVKGYEKSKFLAEKSAWAIAHEKKILLETVCPGLVVGPILAKHHAQSTSSQYVERLLKGGSKSVNIRLPYADVRNVAEVHVKALTHGRLEWNDLTPVIEECNIVVNEDDDPETQKKKKQDIKDHQKKLKKAWSYGIIYGNRYICASDDGGNVGMVQACNVLREFAKNSGCTYSPSQSKYPDWVATMFGGAISDVKTMKYFVNFCVPVDTQMTTRVLGVKLDSYEVALCDHAISLMKVGGLAPNGYNSSKLSTFSPYPQEMKAWKDFVGKAH